ncbi:MAG: hypothetical protein OMM_01645 [Candidatus Magnetoglobus multicellularis str. Araruama]|uniref:Adenylate/guanylate cyclase n=1 Tax=Candidatus Magnetoglobus multicellularis str. Araruama TaxID=890399 RepID=A0A1V1PCK6_9BACT|nr:MAG: hypothetical protein OMM_01645 [Candidatus Magnetoglobus multicellularis str. Araruama]
MNKQHHFQIDSHEAIDTKHHIYIVDTDIDNQKMLANKLEMNNFQISTVTTIIDAFQMIEASSMPDLILLATTKSESLDIQKLILFREKFPQNILPIIVFAAKRHLSKDIVQFFQAGINDYISKPVVVQELFARISTHISMSLQSKRSKEMAIHEYLETIQTQEKINQIREKYEDRHIKVLMVDDQVVSGKTVSGMFANENDIDFYFCNDERKAIKTAERILPHVILQDIEMPHINGLILVCMYKQNKRIRSIPVIILSSRNDNSSKCCSFSAGACDFIVKPPNRHVLLDRIRYHAQKCFHENDSTMSKKSTALNTTPTVRPGKINIDDYRQTKNRHESSIKVLLVDDQAFIGKVVGKFLENEKDIDYFFCQDPLKAIDVALEIKPTVIIQDLTMPEIDGLSMIKAFREVKELKRTPLVMLSSQEKAMVKDDAFTLGANDYIVKPPDRIELIARIRYHSKAYNTILQLDDAYKEVKLQRTELEIRNNFIKKTFGRYLSDNIVSSILDTPEGMALGGEKRKVTILMSDLRGFTTIAENLKPEMVLSILNIYLEIMTEIVLKYDGTIDEIIGDAILVIFGAPIYQEDDAIRAVACALEMQTSMEKVNQKNLEYGYPKLQMGIGINTGEVVVGNIGSDMRSKYGIVGSNVNLTSRIESYTVGNQVFISESTYQECGSRLTVNHSMKVMPKGVNKPINIYDITGIAGEYKLNLPKRKPIRLNPLKHPKDITLSILDGKDTGTETYKGKVLKTAENVMHIQTSVSLNQLTNIKIVLWNCSGEPIDGDIYAKVVACNECQEGTYEVNLTSISQNAEKELQSWSIITL